MTQRSQDVRRAYIFPPHTHGTEESNPDFMGEWYSFQCEFGVERADRWRDAIMTGTGDSRKYDTDRPENMITLSLEVQRYWEDDLCAFHPISLSDNKKSMTLAFHWLPVPDESQLHEQLDIINLQDHPYPHQRMGCLDTPGRGIQIHDPATNKPFSSGHIITIETEDPVKMPLPSIDLLDMQWMMKRSSRLSGESASLRDKVEHSRMKGYCWIHRGKVWSRRRRAWVYSMNLRDLKDGEEEDPEDSEYEFDDSESTDDDVY